ncbi:LppX_LprAFG lipoprotein [Streptosporangium sandarakinum]|uniref:LppX_LprAFG lipoprotein n=1 Tax=Streptosporangium sandarakinum TaxID=1260955 RepID=UPI0033A0A292
MRRYAPALALGAAALVTATGCGAQSAGSGVTSAGSLGTIKLAAADAVLQSAQKAEEATSYTADLVAETTGGDQGAGKIQGTVRYQSKPELAADVTLSTIAFGGQNVPGGVRAILTGDSVYVKSETLRQFAGTTKPWGKVSLTDLGTGEQAKIRDFMAQAQQFDLAGTVKMLTTSEDVKAVGTETVGGVETTHYSGTFPVDKAAQAIDPAKREQLQRQLAEVKDVKFDLWADAQSLPRKVTMSGSEQGTTFNATVLFKNFNEPVQVAAPPADQVEELRGRTGGN